MKRGRSKFLRKPLFPFLRGSKKGGMTIGQIVKLILAIAVVFILLFLSVRLLSPIFNRGDETAKSYMETLKDEIKVADKGRVGEFYMWWVDGREGEKDFYLVYFGLAIEAEIVRQITNPKWTSSTGSGFDTSRSAFAQRYIDTTVSFNTFGRKPNRICVCYTEGNANEGYDSFCDYCEDLDYPAVFENKTSVEGTWIEESGNRINITLEGEKYVFAEVE